MKVIEMIKSQVKAHPLLAGVMAVALLFLAMQFVGGFVDGLRHALTRDRVTATETAAQNEQTKAQSEIKQAGEERIERRVEDGTRERVIVPEIERTSRAVAEARERTKKAVKTYEATQTGNRRIDLNDSALHSINCADLRSIYPGQKFSRCE